MKKTENDSCWHCGKGVQQTREHLFAKCEAFKEERKELERTIRSALKEEALKKGKTSWKWRLPIREYFARNCITGAVMEFLRATTIGRTGRPPEEQGRAQ